MLRGATPKQKHGSLFLNHIFVHLSKFHLHYYTGYLPAVYAEFLSILTCIVRFVLFYDGYHESVVTIRCSKQIFTDFLWKHQPPMKPP